jgi:septum formation protein
MSTKNLPHIILASQSPQRAKLLQQINLPFKTLSLGEDAEKLETTQPNETPSDYVRRVAGHKWENAYAQLKLQSIIQPTLLLTADTCVYLGSQLFLKPNHEQDILNTLKQLSGQTHWVETCVCLGLIIPNPIKSTPTYIKATSQSQVRFKPLNPSDLSAYIATKESWGRAGCYAIQGRAASWIEWIEGSYSGIMGLPLYETAQLFEQLSFPVFLWSSNV